MLYIFKNLGLYLNYEKGITTMYCPSFIFCVKMYVAITVSFFFCFSLQCPLIKGEELPTNSPLALETLFGLNTEHVMFVLVLCWAF